jgi:hypothetical protein
MLNPAVVSGGAQDDESDRTSTLSIAADVHNVQKPHRLGWWSA